eukprot:m.16021 g.16021  ORF g.16021 m.16021 type:complete len:131 (+) comp7971_c0_seq1:61-453(+)
MSEDANALHFNEDFEDPQTVPLLLSEVGKILEARQHFQRLEDPEGSVAAEFTKTLEYVQRFGSSRSYEVNSALRNIVENKSLHKYEQVQLINLAPESVEEAKALIPSLTRIDDDILEDVVQQIMAFKSFS